MCYIFTCQYRNAADILSSMEILKFFGVNLICVEKCIDSSQTSGKLLISVISAVAEIERENFRINAVLAFAAKNLLKIQNHVTSADFSGI